MRPDLFLLSGLAASAIASAVPAVEKRQSANPFSGRTLMVNPFYSEQLEQTRQAFASRGDNTNAGKVRFVQERVGTFVWVSNIYLLRRIDDAIRDARAAQARGETQIVGIVLYNLPGRDCSAGESAGELGLDSNGLARYRSEYVNPFAQKLKAASDLQFAVVVEPDALGNMVTGGNIPFCARAREPQQDAIAYAIQQMQASNIHLYLDVANGGWLGWQENLGPTADTIQSILRKAGNARVRGYATNVSNYNPFSTNNPPPFTAGSPSADESRYVSSLSGPLAQRGLPTRFIVDQGRVARDGARSEWGQWCNVEAGFGQPFTTNTGNSNVDAIVWIKPGGESDGACGMSGAPQAGQWFDSYAQTLTRYAHSSIQSIGGGGSPPPPPSNGGGGGGGGAAPAWGQCGGEGWSGPTRCESGTCVAQNPYYSQCIP